MAAANIIQLESLIPRLFPIRGSKDFRLGNMLFAFRRLSVSSKESRSERAIPGLIPRKLLPAS